MTNRSGYNLGDIVITGIKNEHGKCYTQPLLFPSNIRLKSVLAIVYTSIDMILVKDDVFLKDYKAAVNKKFHNYQVLLLFSQD